MSFVFRPFRVFHLPWFRVIFCFCFSSPLSLRPGAGLVLYVAFLGYKPFRAASVVDDAFVIHDPGEGDEPFAL